MDRIVFALPLLLWAAPVWADAEVAEFSLEEVELAEESAAADVAERPVDVAALPTVLPGALERELKEFSWGMSQRDVLDVLKERIRAEYEPRIRTSLDAVKQDALIQEAKERYRAIKRNFVKFDGRITGWDVSPVAPEFRHGSRETMLVVRAEGSRDFYFFINNRLWKYYRELDSKTFQGLPYDTVAASFQRRFGKGERGYGTRAEDAPPSRWIEWNQAGSKLTALERGAQYCLILEDQRTLTQLALLRRNALSREKKRNSTVDAILMTDADRQKLHDDVDRRLSTRQ